MLSWPAAGAGVRCGAGVVLALLGTAVAIAGSDPAGFNRQDPTCGAPSQAVSQYPSPVALNDPQLLQMRRDHTHPLTRSPREVHSGADEPTLLRLHRLQAEGLRPLLPRWRDDAPAGPFAAYTAPATTPVRLMPAWVADPQRWGVVQERFLATAGCNCLQPTASPGRVPDGEEVRGTPLRVGKSATESGSLDLTWGASCNSGVEDYSVHEGSLGAWYDHSPGVCTTNGTTHSVFAPADGNRYYLIVPLAGDAEGHYGVDSAGAVRPPSVRHCRTQVVVQGCP